MVDGSLSCGAAGDYGHARGGGGRERGLASNRLATVFFYLNDVPDGGATAFPRAGGGEQPRDFRNCHQPGWLNVHPSKRRVVIFYSMLPSGEFDHYSLHAGCDVGANGTKWAANYWSARATPPARAQPAPAPSRLTRASPCALAPLKPRHVRSRACLCAQSGTRRRCRRCCARRCAPWRTT